jgi:hypothetical protein
MSLTLVVPSFDWVVLREVALDDARIAAVSAWKVGAFEDLGDHLSDRCRVRVRGENPPGL